MLKVINKFKYTISSLDLLLVAYLFVPSVLFSFYYRNLLSLFPGILLIIFGIVLKFGILKIKKEKIIIKEFIFIFLIVFLVCLFCGIFPHVIGNEHSDWLKHNTILNDLVLNSWPVKYLNGDLLNYYLGIYLFPALLGKIFTSLIVAKIALSLYIFLGIFLGFIKLFRLWNIDFGFKVFIAAFFFLFFSGWDWLSYLFTYGAIPLFPQHIEWGVGSVQLPSIVTLIGWVPQHFISSLLGVILIFGKKTLLRAFVIPLVMLWSPFSAVGLGILFLIQFFSDIIRDGIKIKEIFFESIFLLILSILVVTPYLFFYFHHFPMSFAPVFLTWVTTYRFFLADLLPIVLFILLVELPLRRKISLFVSLLGIFLITLFSWGSGYNDFATRVPVPLLIYIVIILSYGFVNLIQNKKWNLVIVVVIIFLLGILTPFSEIARLIAATPDVVDPLKTIQGMPIEIVNQYLGCDTLFCK